MQKIAHDFCFAFVTKFMEAGFRIGWFFVARKVVLKDGRSVGPGFAVYLLRPRKNEGKEAKRDLRAQEAIALGNAMKFCQDGVRVSIKELEVGIVCGGPIDEALLEHELGEDRLLSEHLGLGAELARREIGELERLCTRLESIQKEWKFGLSEEEQENWQEHLGKLKSQVKRRIKMAQVLDDAEVWMTAQEEVEQACPAFKRKAEQEKWEVFRRIRVRLGLLEDE
jgi:hypothetical protein